VNTYDEYPDDYSDDYSTRPERKWKETDHGIGYDFSWVRDMKDLAIAVEDLEHLTIKAIDKLEYAHRQANIIQEKENTWRRRENEMNRKEKELAELGEQLANMESQLVVDRNLITIEASELNERREKIAKANVDPVKALDEILLMLELEEDPKVIHKYMKQRREDLEPKW
jgi:hypothetical protein